MAAATRMTAACIAFACALHQPARGTAHQPCTHLEHAHLDVVARGAGGRVRRAIGDEQRELGALALAGRRAGGGRGAQLARALAARAGLASAAAGTAVGVRACAAGVQGGRGGRVRRGGRGAHVAGMLVCRGCWRAGARTETRGCEQRRSRAHHRQRAPSPARGEGDGSPSPALLAWCAAACGVPSASFTRLPADSSVCGAAPARRVEARLLPPPPLLPAAWSGELLVSSSEASGDAEPLSWGAAALRPPRPRPPLPALGCEVPRLHSAAHRFFTALSVRPPTSLAISVQRLPYTRWPSMRMRSSCSAGSGGMACRAARVHTSACASACMQGLRVHAWHTGTHGRARTRAPPPACQACTRALQALHARTSALQPPCLRSAFR